jgi:uncharacterized protein YhbP (UPF0306 family)
MVSDPKSRHSVDLEVERRVAATVAPDYFDFDDIRGVQIWGQAQAVTGAADRGKARELLEARYPYIKRLCERGSTLGEAYAKAELYRLQPVRMVFIDNTRGFGHNDILDLAGF